MLLEPPRAAEGRHAVEHQTLVPVPVSVVDVPANISGKLLFGTAI